MSVESSANGFDSKKMKAALTRQFTTDRASAAAKQWEESVMKVRAAQRTGASLERVKLDVSIARQQYEALRTKLAEAANMEELHARQQSGTLELTTAPTVPSEWRPPVWLAALSGAAGGIIALAWTQRPVRARAI